LTFIKVGTVTFITLDHQEVKSLNELTPFTNLSENSSVLKLTVSARKLSFLMCIGHYVFKMSQGQKEKFLFNLGPRILKGHQFCYHY
jgi:hypothetical protein